MTWVTVGDIGIGCRKDREGRETRGLGDNSHAGVRLFLALVLPCCARANLDPLLNIAHISTALTLEAEQQALEALGWSYSLEQLRKAEVIRL